MRITLAHSVAAGAVLSIAAVVFQREGDNQKAMAALPQATPAVVVPHEAPVAGERVNMPLPVQPAPAGQTLVSLADPRVSIQTAVQRLCAQAGTAYDFRRSVINTGQACRRYVSVEVSEMTLEAALDQVVAAQGLRWKKQNNVVWLER